MRGSAAILLLLATRAFAAGDGNSASAGTQAYANEALSASSAIRTIESNFAAETVAAIETSSADQIQALVDRTKASFEGFAAPQNSSQLTKPSTSSGGDAGSMIEKINQMGKAFADAGKDPIGYALRRDTKPIRSEEQLADLSEALPDGHKGKGKGKKGKKEKEDEYQKNLKGIDEAYQNSVKGVEEGYSQALSKVQTDDQYKSMIGGIDDAWDKEMKKYDMGPGARISGGAAASASITMGTGAGTPTGTDAGTGTGTGKK